MTLLVLEIAVPQLTNSEVAAGELPKQLLKLWPLIMSYGMSFIILGFFWIYHHILFHYIKRVDRIFVWLTVFYLMFVAFIPFSTALLGEYHDQQISVVIYGINIAIAIISRSSLMGPIFYLIAVALSFVSIIVSLVLFMVIPIYYLVPVRKDKSRFWFTKK
jgi:TMEM175 potassium channel family protein